MPPVTVGLSSPTIDPNDPLYTFSRVMKPSNSLRKVKMVLPPGSDSHVTKGLEGTFCQGIWKGTSGLFSYEVLRVLSYTTMSTTPECWGIDRRILYDT